MDCETLSLAELEELALELSLEEGIPEQPEKDRARESNIAMAINLFIIVLLYSG
jgi:hypothetical protein